MNLNIIKYFKTIKVFDNLQSASEFISKQINLKTNKIIYFTGGNTFQKILKNIAKTINYNSKNFYLTDERITKSKKSSNFYIIKKILPKKIKINFINLIQNNKIIKLPKTPDLIFLSIGKNGHIASLYDKNYIDIKNDSLFNNDPYSRVLNKRATISKRYILRAKKIYLIILGRKKFDYFKIYCKSKLFLDQKSKITIIIDKNNYKKLFI